MCYSAKRLGASSCGVVNPPHKKSWHSPPGLITIDRVQWLPSPQYCQSQILGWNWLFAVYFLCFLPMCSWRFIRCRDSDTMDRFPAHPSRCCSHTTNSLLYNLHKPFFLCLFFSWWRIPVPREMCRSLFFTHRRTHMFRHANCRSIQDALDDRKTTARFSA